jgi:dienelactone hydrolase
MFFNVSRAAYRPEAAMDGWQQIWTWFGNYLS